ncbi:hypothetical protein Rhopal_003166-T1 [Rhodotorula paludigena]|uniref:F-box domain-containing protein n=1 Tax=Rhodotorula paludigena TaxID=86838 RepID=A0AAV5GL14_9BASI|nr:hypothetical protein Rhopal_003166-T1 [Rhodotorula paludigena]
MPASRKQGQRIRRRTVRRQPPGRCVIESIPHELLCRIFEEAQLKLDRVCLSRSLLASALEALYDNVQIYSERMLARFCASLRAQPELAGCVKAFGLSGRDDDDDDDDDEWEDEPSDCALGEVTGSTAVLQLDEDPSATHHRPDMLEATAELLREVLHRLTSLKSILLFGRERIHSVFASSFLSGGGLSRVESVTLALDPGEDWDDYADREICRRLQMLPKLKAVGFFGNRDGMPLGLDNDEASVCLEPQSWALDEIVFSETPWIEPEIRHLLGAIQPGLKRFKVESMFCYRGFADDLRLLPHRRGPIPTFDDVLVRLSGLKHVHLAGPVLASASTLSAFSILPQLVCLHLEYHIPLSGSHLVSLVSTSASLKYLHIHLCCCPTESRIAAGDSRVRARWEHDFRYNDATKLVAAAKRHGVGIGGNLYCFL